MPLPLPSPGFAVKHQFLVIAALLGFFIAGCNGTPERRGVALNRVVMPEWTRTGEHPDYPQSDFLVAYGFARSSAEARSIAIERFENAICTHVRERIADQVVDTHFNEMVTLRAAWFRAGEFGEAVRADAASNGFDSVALRAIDYDELGLRARAMLPDARRELDDHPMPPSGVGSVQRRLELWGNFFLRAVRVVGLELLAEGTLDRAVFDQLDEATLTLWELPSQMNTTRTGGGQHVRIGGGLEDELGLRASFRGTGVEGVPLAWGPAPGYSGDVQGDREFDEDGRATARVLYMHPTGSEVGYVAATIDLDSFMGRAMGVGLNVWLWDVTLPCRANAELVIDVEETINGGAEGFEPNLAPRLEEWCEARELKTSRGEASGRDLPYRLVLSGDFRVNSSVTGDIPTAVASGELVLTDEETGQVLFRYGVGLRRRGEPEGHEGLLQLGVAREAAADVILELATRLIRTLPAKDSELERPR